MRRHFKKFARGGSPDGSALILTMVLTSLLAIVGVLFLMMARVNKITASSISRNKELDSAVETVIAKISNELVLDVPGVAGAEYYDYPGPEDKWLASLEPYKDGNDYKWRQISDVYNRFDSNVGLQAVIVPDYQEPAQVGDSNNTIAYRADADGDGVADSKWVELADMTSSRGKPVYAAIRIVDNGGMINVNTAYKFDPTDPNAQRIDGSSQLQINLAALSLRGANGSPDTAANKLQLWRCGYGAEPNNLSLYEQNVIWRYGSPDGAYTPFDISDELKLRNRYILNYNLMTSRIEELWERAYDGGLDVPRNEKYHSITNPNDWFWIAYNSYPASCPDPCKYDYRHISTTYNMDRIIDPNGNKMTNINDANVDDLYSSVRKGILEANPGYTDVNKVAVQIAVNLIDFRDGDSDVCSVIVDSNTYYGFEQPCVYISELACRLKRDTVNPSIYYRSYAVELYKPYLGDGNPDPNWWLFISNPVNPDIRTQISWSAGASPYHVIRWQDLTDPCVPLDVNATSSLQPIDNPDTASFVVFEAGSVISLTRKVDDVNVVVDSKVVPAAVPGGWLAIDGNPHSIQRDITQHKCIRRLWASAAEANTLTLGAGNSYLSSDPNIIPAHPADSNFTNVGEIGMIFRKGAYYVYGASAADVSNTIGYNSNIDKEFQVRLNLADPNFQQVFKYLTVFDPNAPKYGGHPETETRVKGRININTAPWFVLAQLPWVSQRKTFSTYELAKEIVGYRNDINGFESIGQLCQVGIYDSNDYRGIDYYSRGNGDQLGFPDLTTPDQASGDGAPDDFEERDLIFARISNLVTVRSDVFTAYILVRIGTDGPQKRVIAIFDRSNVYPLPTGGEIGKINVRAVQPVADPR